MKKIKLEVEQIWQKKGTLDVRTIEFIEIDNFIVDYRDIGGCLHHIETNSFRRWIRRNKVELIGHYDFDKKKVRVVK